MIDLRQRRTDRDDSFAGSTQPALCIVIPVLDEAASIGARLRALAPLRERGVRIVVVDGGSADATVVIAERHADRVLRAPRGRGAQMNAGAAACAADAYLFLHADTALPDSADAAVTRALDGGARWGFFSIQLQSQRTALRLVASMMNRRSRWTGIATGDQAIFVRSALFAQVGGFEDVPLMEDIAISRALRRRAAPACLGEVVVTSARRWERHGVWRTVLLMWRLRAAYFFGADPRQLARRYGYRPR